MKNYMNLIEEISLNAWPAHKIQLYDGWLLRFSHNYTHRTNCVNPVAHSTLPLDEKIAFCEREYHLTNTPTIFKISPLLDEGFDLLLEKKEYHTEHITEVMTMPLTQFHPMISIPEDHKIKLQISDTITDDWIDNHFHLNGTTNPIHKKIVPSMFKAIPKPTITATIEVQGKIVASGLGILDRDHVGLYAIYVDTNYRKMHFGSTICSTIINNAITKGATHAYLQVVAGNDNAKHLYECLGFEYFYTYWFRVK